MSKRCPDCHRLNDDERIYCAFCGEPLDNNVRMIKSLEKEISTAPKETAQSASRKSDDGDDDYEYIPSLKAQRKKGSAAPWLILLAVVAAVALWFFLSR